MDPESQQNNDSEHVVWNSTHHKTIMPKNMNFVRWNCWTQGFWYFVKHKLIYIYCWNNQSLLKIRNLLKYIRSFPIFYGFSLLHTLTSLCLILASPLLFRFLPLFFLFFFLVLIFFISFACFLLFLHDLCNLLFFFRMGRVKFSQLFLINFLRPFVFVFVNTFFRVS